MGDVSIGVQHDGTRPKTIVVIGAGVTGLLAAQGLVKASADKTSPKEIINTCPTRTASKSQYMRETHLSSIEVFPLSQPSSQESYLIIYQ